MSADQPTNSGSAAETRGGLAGAIVDSMIAAGTGLGTSFCLMCVCDLCFFAFFPQRGVPAEHAIGNVVGIIAAEMMWNEVGSLAGWLLFLFPIALLHRRWPITDRMLSMCLTAALCGALMTGLELMPFSGWPFDRISWIFVPFGAIDAVVATATFILLRRKLLRQLKQGV